MSHSLLRQYVDAPFEVATLGGRAGSGRCAAEVCEFPAGARPGAVGREERENPRNGCSGVKKFPRCRVGGRLTGKQGGRDKVKIFAPGES